ANLRMHMFDVRLDPGHMLDINPTQAGKVAERVLEKRPQPARPVETFVIETGRQKPIEPIKRAKQIEAELGPGILMAHDLSLLDRLNAGAYIGAAVHRHETVRTIAGNAKKPARAMVFEATREDAHARGIKGSGDALACQGGKRSPIERERPNAIRVGQLAG